MQLVQSPTAVRMHQSSMGDVRRSPEGKTECVSTSDKVTFHLVQELAKRARKYCAPLLGFATINTQV